MVNDTLHNVIKKIERENTLEESNGVATNNLRDNENAPVEINPYLCLPYKGKQGENVVNKFKGFVNNILPSNVKPRYTYKGKKLGSCFPIKDKIKREHLSNLVYAYSAENSVNHKPDYIGESSVRFETRIHEHTVTDKNSSIFKLIKSTNIEGCDDDFSILGRGYNKTFDRKIAESLYVKQYKPILNEQGESYKLTLFN